MVSIYDFNDYRRYLTARIQEMPKQGYGQLRKLAEHLGVHTTLVSQILRGKKGFTPDQGAQVADYLSLGDLETEYLVGLVHLERAGNKQMRHLAQKQLAELKAKAQQLKNRVRVAKALSEEQRALFYSDWAYSAVRQLTALSDYKRVDVIATALNLPRRRVVQIIAFLLEAGLCREVKGELQVGPASTHLEGSSPWVHVHHRNWRDRAMTMLGQNSENGVHFSSPMTLSARDAEKIREMSLRFMEEVYAVVDPSPSETLYCLNLDWFKAFAGSDSESR